MQVWSQRRHLTEAAPRPSAKLLDGGVAEVWALRVLSGVHVGAERKLPERCVLVIGSADDCDLIFTDDGVAGHHCIVDYARGAISIRAMDADVRVDEQIVHPGDPQTVAAFALVRIGGACFSFGPHWSERWQTLLAKIEPPSTELVEAAPAAARRGGRIATLGVAVGLLLASGGALVLAQHRAPPAQVAAPAKDRSDEAGAIVRELGLGGVHVTRHDDGSLGVQGYVENDGDLAALRGKLDAHGLKADVDVKSGARIAADISETFRMRNLHATTQWKGNGVVEVSGHFGDGKDLDEFVRSRTVQDYNDKLNLKLVVENLDGAAPVQPVGVPDTKRIRRIVDGTDPYLVAVDNSRYYVGGKLPNGKTFVGIDNDEVLVRDEAGNTERLPRESVIDAH
ncbi:MAG TPA: FHA domain-containing protein [Dokdonella sp.]